MDLEPRGGAAAAAKVSCETLVLAADPNLPAESFQLRIGDEIGWTDINAVYDRDDSTKGNTNPKSHQNPAHPKPPRSTSQRFSGNLGPPKAPIIALPNKVQHSGYLGASRRRPKGRRRAPGSRKPPVPAEPGSPKVSFFGKVLSVSQRERCRRPREKPHCEDRRGGGGCWAGLLAFLSCGGGGDRAGHEPAAEETRSSTENSSAEKTARPSVELAEAEAPALGAMKQFASRRRAASWGGDVEAEAEEDSGTLDREVRARRSVEIW